MNNSIENPTNEDELFNWREHTDVNVLDDIGDKVAENFDQVIGLTDKETLERKIEEIREEIKAKEKDADESFEISEASIRINAYISCGKEVGILTDREYVQLLQQIGLQI